MRTPHTPGPWVADLDPEDHENARAVFTDVPGAVNAEICGRIYEVDNAHIIAAAPDMFASLAAALPLFDSPDYDSPSNVSRAALAVRSMRAALAKARGQS